MSGNIYDIIVIGGGINGAGIAADAAGRGLRVLLVEADDLGAATSSASSKLIHGGLRYLEHLEFGLVRAALSEREVLLKKAPHIVEPLEFILPRVDGMRSSVALRAGLFLYDHLSRRQTLGASRAVNLASDAAGRILKGNFRSGFSYWDCAVDDARLVVLNAVAAREKGAEVLTRTPVTELAVVDRRWRLTLGGGVNRQVEGRAVVNASGPWVDRVGRLAPRTGARATPKVRLVKGSHIVVPRVVGADQAYIFQNSDGRVVFMIPWAGRFTMIGTTETAYHGDPRDVAVSDDDRTYLLDAVNHFLAAPLGLADIVWEFAGVRPLDDDGASDASAVSRDYRLQLDTDGGPPLLHVIGGKITTYRLLAEDALATLGNVMGIGPSWTADAPLPGGDVGGGSFDNWFDDFALQRPGINRQLLLTLARRYGTRAAQLLGDARSVSDLGNDLGGGLSEREVTYLKREEFAVRAEDIVWRRTKAALLSGKDKRDALMERVQDALDRS